MSSTKVTKRSMRASFVMLGLVVVAIVVGHAVDAVLETRRWREREPRLAVDSLVKALRTYHKQSGRFPADFQELEVKVWKHKTPPDFGADGRGLAVANYYYIYSPVDAGTCTIWIIPTGPRRDEGSTHFLLLSPDNLRRWKGAPLSLDEVGKLRSVPVYGEMNLLGMTEQSPIKLTKR
jgi:hypothetical protein